MSTPDPNPKDRVEEPTLRRRLGPFDGAAIVVSNVIGSGIFFVPMLVALAVSSGTAMLGVWVFGGVLAFAGAMAYAELATLRPHAGGEYVYLRDAFGPFAAFMTGWTSFVAGFSGAIAATSVGLTAFIGRFVPAAADTNPLLTVPLPLVPLVVSKQALIAIAVIVLLSLVHFHAKGRVVHNLLASAKVALLLAFIVVGFGWGSGSFANITATHDVASPLTGWISALVPVMFAYSGWNAAAYVAEEIKDPSRNVPLALGLGTLGVVVIYLALNLLYLYALPVSEIGAQLTRSGTLTDVVAERLFGFVAGNVITIFFIVSTVASISAMVLAGPRVYFAMARDHVFLESAARVHATYRTPMLAITAQAIWASVLVLCGNLQQLISYTGFAVVLFAGVAVAALFVLRRREPHAERPFKAVGYPLAPAFFIAASVWMLIAEAIRVPDTTAAGLAVIAAGIPAYFVFAARAKSR